MKRYRVGIRKEDESKRLERRTPLVPDDVRALLAKHPELDIWVERSEGRGFHYERCFADADFAAAGATLVESLDECPTILGIKEIGVEQLCPDKAYAFFSHTYKGQPYNLPLLKRLQRLGCTLVDYEMIVEDVPENAYRAAARVGTAPAAGQKRTVYFGKFAGNSGVVDSLWALGARLTHEGHRPNPFDHLRKSLDYCRDGEPFGRYDLAMEAIAQAAARLRTEGLPDAVTPLVVGIAGRGNAARGTREVLEALPTRAISPEELLAFAPPADEARHTIYLVTFGREHTGAGLDPYLPHLTMLMNCITWDKRAPRLVTRAAVRALWGAGQRRLRVIGDVSCDPGGSIEFSRRTYPDNPVYSYEPARDDDPTLSWEEDEQRLRLWKQTCVVGPVGDGPIVMAVTNLPCEFPRDASRAFSAMLRPHVLDIARLGAGEWEGVARPIQRATMIHAGTLADDYAYLRPLLTPRVLVLGAGQIAPALLSYLHGCGYDVTVADRDLALAQQRAATWGGRALPLELSPDSAPEAMLPLLAPVDVVVSALPPAFHVAVARGCIAARLPLVTASYVSPEMTALDGAARAAGVTLLNEMGLDPGIDHMSAILLLREVEAAGGTVERFHSFCGGLPAPDAATNPLRYKFSWSPAGVVSAMLNDATFRRDGDTVTRPARTLLAEPEPLHVVGWPEALECYPNRNSLPYIARYDVPQVRDFQRGTIRYPGWGHFWHALRRLGWMDSVPNGALPRRPEEIAAALGEGKESALVARLAWLLADTAPADSPLGALVAALLAKPELRFGARERDLVLMQHEVVARFPDGRRERRLSTLTLYGEPEGTSAMSLTTGGTLALGVEAILEGVVSQRGVVVPTEPGLARWALAKLASLGVRFAETVEPLPAAAPHPTPE